MAAMAAILGFRSQRFLLFCIYKSPQCFLSSYKSFGPSVREKKRKIDFQDGGHGGRLGFLIGMMLAIFDLQVTPMLPTKFQINCPFVLEAKKYIFALEVTPMLPTKFQVNWPFGSGEEMKNGFSRLPPWRPSWVSDRNDFCYF